MLLWGVKLPECVDVYVCVCANVVSQAVAMAVAPELFDRDHALVALTNYESHLLGPSQIGVLLVLYICVVCVCV